jgi:uncharacterized protein
LPLPKTPATAEAVIAKVRTVQSRIRVPFLLENISYAFDWPDSKMSDADFLNVICNESGAGLLLDIENLYLNAHNHGFNAYGFLDDLSVGLVKEIHIAGGTTVSNESLQRPFLADSHSHPIPNEALDLLKYALSLHAPDTVILERDDRLDKSDEILRDVDRIRSCIDRWSKDANDTATFRSSN